MRKLLILFFMWSSLHRLYAVKPIVPTDVLSSEGIQKIVQEKNYFLYKDMDITSPIWRLINKKKRPEDTRQKRPYGDHYMRNRNFSMDMDQVVTKTLVDGFNVQLQLESLYREKMRVHEEIGEVIPHIDIDFGQGATYGINSVFKGLFGFLLPSQWMGIANQKKIYDISKYYMSLKVLDEVKKAKLEYLAQHQRIQEFQIINYYFIHLQILADYNDFEFHLNPLFMGAYSSIGTDMASKRGDVKLGFDDLAHMMGMERDDVDRTAGRLNIDDIIEFPDEVKQIDDLEEILQDKNTFLEKVVERSIELKAIRELYDVSKLNIGIEALGGTFSEAEGAGVPRDDARFAIKLGYGTIPSILESVSRKRTARIDVRKEYIDMLNNARISYDLYTNSLGGFTEARRAMEKNRKLLKTNIERFLSGKDPTGGIPILLTIKFLMHTELKYNNALHGSLKALAHIKRFLVNDVDQYLKYVPKQQQILKAFKKSAVPFDRTLLKSEKFEHYFQKLKSPKLLSRLLFEDSSEDADLYSSTDKKERVEICSSK